ncbi:MAG: hypothetical protein RBQ97_05135 [Acholeplasma sp.]|nr:hypothetical protein [Acholeplasma sp.]
MKILYIVSRPLEINTSASIRNQATIKGLIELGHDVKLITSNPDQNHSNYDLNYIPNLQDTYYIKLDGLQKHAKLIRKFRFLHPFKKIFQYMSNKLSLYDNLIDFTNHVDELIIDDNTYDVIISSSDPKSSHLFVYKLFETKKIVNTPWIQIWGDPFSADISRKNRNMNKKVFDEEMKLFIYPYSIIYLSSLTLEEQKKTFPKYSSKMRYVPAPYLHQNIYDNKKINYSSINLLYSGDYSSNIRNILPLYNAVTNTDHKLIICGNSDKRLQINDNIQIFPRLKFEEVKILEKNADVLVHLSNTNGNQIPGKIYQYAGTNKIILFILDGKSDELKTIYSKYNRFIFCNNETDSILQVFNKFEEYTRYVDGEPLEEFSPRNISYEIIKNVKL